jgi:hypothetical protein
LAHSGQWGDAERVLDDNLRRMRLENAGDSPDLARALIRRGSLQLDRHEVEAIRYVRDGVDMLRRTGGTLPSECQQSVQSAVLAALGSWECQPNGKLPAQVYCALDEMLRHHPRLEELTDMLPGSVHYTLYAPNRPNSAPLMRGTLAYLPDGPVIRPGICRLDLDIDRAGGTPIHETHWVLFTPWEVSVYSGERRSILPAGLRSGTGIREAHESEGLIRGGAAASVGVHQSLAFMSSLKASPAPGDRAEDFAIVARSTVNLPAGAYRILATSDDGVRVYVDGRRVIDAWAARAPQTGSADVRLATGQHDLRVEYFQAGGTYKLWVRVEPL